MVLQPEYTLPQELATNDNLTHELINDQIFQNILYILRGNWAAWDTINTSGALSLDVNTGRVMMFVARSIGNIGTSPAGHKFLVDNSEVVSYTSTEIGAGKSPFFYPVFNLSAGIHTFSLEKIRSTSLFDFAVWEF